MSRREFHFISGTSSKFWAIELNGDSFTVTYGKLGTDGTSQVKKFGSEAEAKKNYDKLVVEKTSKGYVEMTKSATSPSAGAASSKGSAESDGALEPLSPLYFATTPSGNFERMSMFIGQRIIDVDEEKPIKHVAGRTVYRVHTDYESSVESPELLEKLLASDVAESLTGLVFGSWSCDGPSPITPLLKQLVDHKEKLSRLQGLFVGDILQEENEISWIEQDDYSDILAAFPNLELLRIRGATGLSFNKAAHKNLRALGIESGGLSPEVVAQLCRGSFPKLEYLELWLGTPGYGGDCTINDLQPILSGKAFPNLKYLGLRNSEISDDIAGVVVKAPIINSLETLDLSLGILSDEGANALLGLKSASLKRLDLHHHFMTKQMVKKIKALPFITDTSDGRSEANEDFDDGDRFIAVSE